MNIALLGYGKMGKTLERLASGKGHRIVFKRSGKGDEGTITDADAAIDFSTPEAAFENIKWALEQDIPVVSGTTGWLEDYSKITGLCQARNGSFIYASNFSVGVNLFFTINEYAARLMQPWKQYMVSIEEAHHTQKKDAPSGTAIALAEGILKHSDKKGWKLDKAEENEIKITAQRLGDVKGVHKVEYTSKMDVISLKHEAHNREGFALGAILAAEWLLGKKGFFTMKDVLGIK